MNRKLMMLVIGILFGSAIGFLTAGSYGITFDGHDHGADHGSTGGHDHGALPPLELQRDAAPTLLAFITKDPKAGWNLAIEVSDFEFAPQNASLAHVPGEGHAHVYINGDKRARVYGPWFHIDHLPAGDVVVEVSLNANDHRELQVDGTPLRARLIVQNGG